MSQDLCNVGRNAMNVTKADIHTPYTNVIVIVGTEVVDGETVVKQYVAQGGSDEGLTLEIECPWGTQTMANNLLAKMNNVRYKPYTVTSALLDPSVELGDAVNTNAVFGGMYTQQSTFGHGFYSDYSAPEDEQMNHEYKYESTTDRRITREENNTKAQFAVQQGQIDAKVSEEGQNSTNTFSWTLKATGFDIKSNNSSVFTVNSTGLTVNGSGTFGGTLYAKDGRIGATKNAQGQWTGGFILKASKFYTDGHSAYNTNADGVYVGTDGIGCGGAFNVTNAGVLNASNATIKGNLTVDSITFSSGVTISGANITDGTVSDGKISGVSGSKVGSGINGANLSGSTVSSAKFDSTTKTTHDNGGTAYSYTSDISGTTVKDRRVTAKTGTFTNLSVSGTLTVKNGSQQGTCYTTTIDGITVLAVH